MLTNIELFNYSKANPEELLDPYYAKNKIVIPSTKDQDNELTANNKKLLDLITAFSVLEGKYHKDFMDDTVKNIVNDVISILDETENINYSAFVQFFMVHNFNYSLYQDQRDHEYKKYLIYEMLKKYCSERHALYSNHGYTNVILQVMCDNYSHKRNSKTGIEKVLSILNDGRNFSHLKKNGNLLEQDNYYFLPDKGDKKIFETFLDTLNLKMESRNIEQNKLPDIVFKTGGQYYVCELKTMKEGGGGQHKQIVEVAYFIKFTEDTPDVHYITFLDCNYANLIFRATAPKIAAQREDIIRALKGNPGNYFLNTAGLIEFIKEIYVE